MQETLASSKGHEDEFDRFQSSKTPKEFREEFLAASLEVLEESKVPEDIREEAYSKLSRSQITKSRLRLVYCYKLAFEAMRARIHGEAVDRQNKPQS